MAITEIITQRDVTYSRGRVIFHACGLSLDLKVRLEASPMAYDHSKIPMRGAACPEIRAYALTVPRHYTEAAPQLIGPGNKVAIRSISHGSTSSRSECGA